MKPRQFMSDFQVQHKRLEQPGDAEMLAMLHRLLSMSLLGAKNRRDAHLGRAADDVGVLLGVDHLGDAAHVVDEQAGCA